MAGPQLREERAPLLVSPKGEFAAIFGHDGEQVRVALDLPRCVRVGGQAVGGEAGRTNTGAEHTMFGAAAAWIDMG